MANCALHLDAVDSMKIRTFDLSRVVFHDGALVIHCGTGTSASSCIHVLYELNLSGLFLENEN